MIRRVGACLLLLGVSAATMRSQSAPVLEFVSPRADDYLSGPVQLRVALRGAGGTSALDDVTFFADGRRICVAPGTRAECAWDAGPELKEHVLRAVARLKDGGRAIANLRTKALGYTESVSVEIVQLNVVVTDGGKFVKGLTRDQFRVLDNKQARTLTTFEPTGAPLELVLALDVSASMADSLSDVKAAARVFLQELGPGDHVTIVAFNDSMFTLAQRATEADVRLTAVDRLSAWGGTALYDVIARAVEILSRQPGRRTLVLFSDGDDRSSQTTFEQVQRIVSNSDATLFAVGLGRGASVKELQEKLSSLADSSGGRAVFAERSDKLSAQFAEIVRDLSAQYTLGIEPMRDGRYHDIDVQIQGKGYKVRTRQGYTASGGTPGVAR